MQRRESKMPKEVSPDTLRRVAGIIGPSSAAAAALTDLERRTAEGEDARCYQIGQTFVVGPAIQ